MTKKEIIEELIQIARYAPEGDYYVGSIGTELRQLLRKAQGKAYDPVLVDGPPKKKRKPTKDERRWISSYAKNLARHSIYFQRIEPMIWPDTFSAGCGYSK